ncbi:ATP-binding cassette, subfamily B [Palleronia marisminoris]|uniref:Putative multidrug export ATP-binding/permease protein n=1 Tax=Palleronia marisminoris TaxID=315423 RepID=A0A1Y5RNF6_9RHOB|nr:ABC transporter ATP-binding protein [Palleronia marisminoris]SFG27068.1 ATP-binding cassette, subfamily B [Palleronia marisminoris]SLN20568.1 Putative multidrug export ATP-binding/permease protein [Palleronia marisminoris]
MSRKESPSETLPTLRHVLSRLYPYMRPHRKLLGGSLLALLAATAMKLLEPWPLKFIIDRVVPSAAGEDPATAALAPMTLLALCVAGLLAVIGLRALFQYLSTLGFAFVGNQVLTDVRADLFRHLQSLSLGFHARARAGDLTMRLIGDVGMLKETAVTAALPLLANVLIFSGMIGVMLWLDWRLALLALSPLPLLWLLSQSLTRKIRTVSRKQRKRQGELAATSAETMSGIRSIQALGLEEQVSAGFAGANAKDMREGVEGKRLSAGLERSVDLLAGVGLAVVLWFGTLQVLRGRITPGDLLIFVSYLKHTFRPIRDYAKYTARLAKAAAAGERVVAILDEVPLVADAPDARTAEPFVGRIAFQDVSFRYGDAGLPTLAGVNLILEPGRSVAVTGPSGVGKSTLASLVLRLHDPSEGRVLIDDVDIRSITLSSLRAQICLVPQEPLIIRGTIAENIVLGAGREVTPAEIEDAARLANAHEFILEQPDGYRTEVAECGATLSTGQRQRIAIARAALRDSPILILDEPTVGLDRASEQVVAEAIWHLARARTTILVTHDLNLAARADRVLVLDDGQIGEDGSPSDLMSSGGKFAGLRGGARSSREADRALAS